MLGASGAHPTAGQACSGFLLHWAGLRIVLDLGYGTLGPLLEHVPDGAVDALIVTHEHPDHCLDLHGLFRLRHHGHPGAARLPLLGPPGVLERLAGIEPDVDLTEVFEHRPLPGTAQVGPLKLTGMPLPHFVPTVGVRLEHEGVALAYATDTGPTDTLAELGRDADLFIVDATDRPGEDECADRNLLTAVEAGTWARRAGARRLLLTHLWPGTDPAQSVARARQGFDGPVLVARQGLAVDLEG